MTDSSNSSRRASGVMYEICVTGQLDNSWADWLEEMTITAAAGYTHLRGPVIDQSALFGLLKRLHNLGLTLISVKRLEEEA
jgi:hypothetical protein